MLLLVLKSIHVLGAVLFLGTGLGSAWYKLRADRSGDLRVVVWCQREIVLADWLFTVPAGVIMPVTGIWLVKLYGLPWETPWVVLGFVGWAGAGALWLPAAYLQVRMRRLAEAALASGGALPPEFHRANRLWLALGFPAFLLSGFTIWGMVAKYAAFTF